MVDGVRDTIYTHTLDKVCVIGATCKIHNHVLKEIVGTPEPFTFINHYMGDTSMFIYQNQWGEVLYVDELLTNFEANDEVEVEPSLSIPFRASDTIQPCDAKWLIRGEKLNLKPIISHKTELTMNQPYQYSDLSNSIVMMLMLLATSIWLYRSTFYWLEMIRKINKIVRS
jgi:hypothetical protein